MKNKTFSIIICLTILICLILTFPLIKNVKSKDIPTEINLTFQLLYEKCGHVDSYTPPEKQLLNNINELKTLYPSWDIKTVENNNILLTKKVPKYCSNHFFIQLNNNKITVTRLDNNTVSNTFYISLKYLTDDDILQLKNGITINSQSELTEFIEDFTS